MANLTKYSLAKLVDPRVYAIFESHLEGLEQEKLDKVLGTVDTLIQAGKKPERAMADSLEKYKLHGTRLEN